MREMKEKPVDFAEELTKEESMFSGTRSSVKMGNKVQVKG